MSGAPPRVLLVAPDAQPSDAALHAVHLLEWLASEGDVEPHVVLGAGGPLLGRLRAAAARVTVASPPPSLDGAAATARRAGRPDTARRMLDAWHHARVRHLPEPALILVTSLHPDTLALLRALDRHTAPIHLHVQESAPELDALDDHGLDRVLRDAHGISVGAAAVADGLEARGLVHGSLRLAPPFLNVARTGADAQEERARAPRADESTAVLVGPGPTAATDLVLHALWHQRQLRPDLAVRVTLFEGCSTPDERVRSRDEVARLGLGGIIERRPGQPGLPDLARADLVVLPRSDGTTPRAALVAAAAGRPVVGFASGGITEIVTRVTGRLVDHPDTVALADALVELAGDATARDALGRAAAEGAKQFDTTVGGPRAWEGPRALLDTRGRLP